MKRMQAGMSMIESLLVAALVLIAIYGLFQTLSAAFSQDSINEKVTNGRLLAAKVASEVFARPGYFPTIKRENDQHQVVVGTFIHCFDRKGQPQPTADGNNRSTLLFLADYNSSSGACGKGALLEVRVVPSTTAEEYTIDVVDLKPHNFLSSFTILTSRKVRKTHYL